MTFSPKTAEKGLLMDGAGIEFEHAKGDLPVNSCVNPTPRTTRKILWLTEFNLQYR
jgi:hypothetical protein